MVLVSACLLGENCRYDGDNSIQKELLSLLADKDYLPICPEVLGGLGIPRPPSEINGGTGEDVLKGEAVVRTIVGEDVTSFFLKGAKKALDGIEPANIDFAILKSRSPSCGVYQIYDGDFNGKLKEGPGVTAALLESKNILVFTEEELDKIKLKLKE